MFRSVQRLLLLASFVSMRAGVAFADGDAAPPAPPGPSFATQDIQAAVERHIEATLREGHGVYRMKDDRTHQELSLTFERIGIISTEALWQVHDPSHTVQGRGYFACSMFRPAADKGDTRYDVDFWVAVRDGRLEVVDVLLHRELRLVNGQWKGDDRFQKERIAETAR